MKKGNMGRFFSGRKLGFLSEYDRMLLEHVYAHGGFYNAHAHIDRAYTLAGSYLEHIGTTPIDASALPLSAKQNMVGDLHTGIAYTRENLTERMRDTIERQIAFGVTRLDTCIDATPDLPDDGLLAIHIALLLREEYRDRIAIRIGPNPIFGFKEGTKRWEVFKSACEKCDFISLLPEKDDYRGLAHRDGKVGFETHIRMGLELAKKLGKEVQLHLDQANHGGESGTEKLIEGLSWLPAPSGSSGDVMIKVIHLISPSSYSEERFSRLLEGLCRHRIGVIVCPSAALSMRQLRSLDSPTHNSIARVLELVKAKVPLSIGTDNICDVFVPQGDGDMLTEVKMAGHAVRFPHPSIWAKLACGVSLNQVDIATVGRSIYEDCRVLKQVGPAGWKGVFEQ